VPSPNLDLVRSIYADWERGDWSSAEWAHPEIENVYADGPSPGSWEGEAGMAAAARDRLDVWEDFRVKAEEYRALDDERVLVLVRFSGRGKASGLEVGQMRTKGAHLFHITGGEVTRLVIYWDREHALADLGLAAEGDSVNAMSERNVELLRRWFEGFNARDVEAVIAVCDPSGVFISTFAVGGAAVYHGHDGMRRYFGDLAEAWGDEIFLEPKVYYQLGEHALAFGVSHGRGRRSGAVVGMPFASVARCRDGRMVYLKGYAHREDALRDLGVSEDELEPIEP
jgi:ketosteroid isomerase-like protein